MKILETSIAAFLCLVIATVQTVTAQDRADQAPQANAASLTFDAATIKVDTSGSGRHSLTINMPGGRMRAINVSLAGLMRSAYKAQASRIVGAPSWFDSEYFDIEATHADPGPRDSSTFDGNQLRLQALLADRFKLKVHPETRDLPILALVIANAGKYGPRLQLDANCDDSKAIPNAQFAPSNDMTLSDIHCGNTSTSGSRNTVHFVGHGTFMDRFMEQLEGPAALPNVDRPIVDRTGITVPIDFTLDFLSPTGATSGQDTSGLSPLPTALTEQLGLKLKNDTGPVEVIVIDHVEQPSAN